uniref:Uncharacterized protein n=1 Tax=Oryza brachyantha TaxID=4533 RepID=J3M7J6_ORYBR
MEEGENKRRNTTAEEGEVEVDTGSNRTKNSSSPDRSTQYRPARSTAPPAPHRAPPPRRRRNPN